MKSSLNREVSLVHLKLLLEKFATLPNHINYLHHNIEDMEIIYFYHNFLCNC